MKMMTKMMTKMMAFLGGGGFLGYMWLKKHPQDVAKLKEMGRSMSKKIYDKLEEE